MFYKDEDISSSIRKALCIVKPEDIEVRGNTEMAALNSEHDIDAQLKKAKWSDTPIGRWTMLYYLRVDKSGDVPLFAIVPVHVMQRNLTKEESIVELS